MRRSISGAKFYKQRKPMKIIMWLLISLAIIVAALILALYICCGENLVYTTQGVRVSIPWLDKWLGR